VEPVSATELPIHSGIAAVTLKERAVVVAYNHTPRGRSPLNVAVSKDGKSWKMAAVLEDSAGRVLVPAIIQTADGRST